MKKSRFSDSQIMAILKQAESGVPVPELCREHGMSSAERSGQKDTPSQPESWSFSVV
jgi:putative transposase